MKKLFYFIICIPALLWLTSCDVHELPKAPEYVKLRLQLNYETDMTIWESKRSLAGSPRSSRTASFNSLT